MNIFLFRLKYASQKGINLTPIYYHCSLDLVVFAKQLILSCSRDICDHW